MIYIYIQQNNGNSQSKWVQKRTFIKYKTGKTYVRNKNNGEGYGGRSEGDI